MDEKIGVFSARGKKLAASHSNPALTQPSHVKHVQLSTMPNK
jgi:hypothetical protein